jgi:two-component system OmpR family sensor kinase/two-component system sensor histidine kinase BaeS
MNRDWHHRSSAEGQTTKGPLPTVAHSAKVGPHWWPAGEPWPPHGRRWPRRRFFLIRVALFFAVLLGFSAYGAITLFRNVLGDQSPQVAGLVTPILLLFAVIVLFTVTMRRVGRPLGDVVAAAEHVSGGDFSVRVAEHGPPWLRSVARAFNSMTMRLEAQRRQRRELMADVAHELRTPLTVIQGRLEGMIDGVYTPDARQIAQLLDETRLLSRLVDDLRTLAHTESGTLSLEKEDTDLRSLLEETAAAFRAEAGARRITVHADIAEDLPSLPLDPIRWREVMANLLSNAIRHSPDGSAVWIEAHALPDAVMVVVKDNGPGIAAEDLPHVFDRFYKGRATGGSGLGLTIARNLVVAHGGTLTAESRTGEGTTMRIRLPLTAAEP